MDDIDISPIYSAVYYDRPNILQYFHNRGIDLSVPCDPANYGNAMFYAISMNRYEVVDMLDRLGYYVTLPCDSFNQLPIYHAKRVDDELMVRLIHHCMKRRVYAAELFRKNYLKVKYRKWYLKMRKSVIVIQRWLRKWLSECR